MLNLVARKVTTVLYLEG